MKPQELRIGNIVGINSVEFEVVGVYDDVAYIQLDEETPIEEIEIKHLEPIPLTEEIILKLGFEKVRNKYYLSHWRFHITKPENYDGHLLCDDDRVITDLIKYLHQLQNLYFDLTGEELLINREAENLIE